MAVTISAIQKGSLADRHGIRVGEVLLSINGFKIVDVLDYRYYSTDTHLELELRQADGTSRTVKVVKEEYQDLGMEFETYLMDKQHSCTNRCIFCFVDQTPKGMRKSLYFKDDDSRLSFFFGNYITLTNMNDEDIRRIIKMRISPINISVHTTDPELRVKMMGNPKAASSLKYLKTLTDGGIRINTQLVLCPGVNDGDALRKTLRDLAEYYPNLQSIACVPVGLTDYREGLYHLEPYTPEQAAEVIRIVDEFADEMKEKGMEERIAYPSDEFFLKAGLPIPEYDYYGDFNQLENGVGLLALLKQEFMDACALCCDSDHRREVSIATGTAAYGLLSRLAEKAEEVYPNLKVHVHRIINDYFGHNITVAGLITGTDLIAQLSGQELGEELLIPTVMLRHEQDVFLDDVSLEELEEKLGVPVRVVPVDGFELLSAMINIGDIYS